jgi:hypothetical protein
MYIIIGSLHVSNLHAKLICLFVYCESHEKFFSYLAIVTITGDRAANLDQSLALLRSYPKDPWFSHLHAVLLAKEQSLPISNVLGLTRPAQARLKLTTSRLLSESTTTRLRQPVKFEVCFLTPRTVFNILWYNFQLLNYQSRH